MNELQIDKNTRGFLRKQVRTADALEILLLLHDHPGIDFSPQRVLQHVQTSQAAVCHRLELLHTKGLVTKAGAAHDPIYRAELGDPGRAEMIARLSRLYSFRRLSVIEALSAPVRSAIGQFRAAFRLKRN